MRINYSNRYKYLSVVFCVIRINTWRAVETRMPVYDQTGIRDLREAESWCEKSTDKKVLDLPQEILSVFTHASCLLVHLWSFKVCSYFPLDIIQIANPLFMPSDFLDYDDCFPSSDGHYPSRLMPSHLVCACLKVMNIDKVLQLRPSQSCKRKGLLTVL